MAWTGSAPNQTYQRTDGVRSGAAVNVTAKNNGVNDTAALADARENDFADALNLVLKRDGGNMPVADIPFDGHILTGIGQGAERDDITRIDQVQDGDLVYAEAGGTANAITLTTTPTCLPVEGMVIGFVAEADSTSTVTINLNTGGALALQVGGEACVGGEVSNGQFHQVGFDGTQWQLLNPYVNGKISAIAGLTPSDGNIIIGDGTTWVAESGSTARTSLGVGTGDSPQFTAVNVGHASDTTITRASAGDIAVEGNVVYRAGGTDVPVTDGGTGASDAGTARTNLGLGSIATQAASNVSITGGSITGITDLAIADGGTGASDAATAFGNLKQAASDSATGVVEIAVQSEMEAGTDTGRVVTPGRQHFHPSAAKAFAAFSATSLDNLSGTYSRSGTTVTVTATAHGFKVGHKAYLDFTSGAATDGNFVVTSVADANTFTVTHGSSGSTSGNVTIRRCSLLRSYGVDSISVISDGVYSVNFATAFSDENYAFVGSASDGDSNAVVTLSSTFDHTTMYCDFNVKVPGVVFVAPAYGSIIFFGDK